MSAFLDNDSFQELLLKWPGTVIQYLRKRYYHKLVHLSEKWTHNREASQDIVNEALIEVWKKSEWLARQKDLLIGPYLLGIVRFKSITFYHRASKQEQVQPPEFLDELGSSVPSMEAEVIKLDRYKRLRDIVSALPATMSACIDMKYFKGMNNEAIATDLGISKKTVEKAIAQGLKNLRAQKFKLQ